jgi:hypothetical protein
MGGKRDGGLFDGDLDWLLNCAASALGLRGTTGSVISMIERGGASAGGSFDEAMLRRIGWSDDPRRRNRNVERARELRARWERLGAEHRKVLIVHYQARDSRTPAAQHIGFCAQVALLLAPNLEGLSTALERPTATENARTIKAARDRAETSVRKAHDAWIGTLKAQAEAWAEA